MFILTERIVHGRVERHSGALVGKNGRPLLRHPHGNKIHLVT